MQINSKNLRIRIKTLKVMFWKISSHRMPMHIFLWIDNFRSGYFFAWVKKTKKPATYFVWVLQKKQRFLGDFTSSSSISNRVSENYSSFKMFCSKAWVHAKEGFINSATNSWNEKVFYRFLQLFLLTNVKFYYWPCSQSG